MPANPPYPGYTWSLTQHQHKITPANVYALAAAALAARTAKQPNRAADSFLEKLVTAGAITLTSNRREGAPRPWRDYQQILPELGLMFSTELIRPPRLTPLGLMYIDGNIGFDELVTTQALRYQYPNGLKTDVQSRLVTALRDAGADKQQSRLHADAEAGVLIRPGALILRVLLELRRLGRQHQLSASQIATYLVPIRRNQDWPEAVAALIAQNQVAPSGVRRNVQDWLKFLGKSILFERDGTGATEVLRLSQVAISSIDQLSQLLGRLEDQATFWVPNLNLSLPALRSSWFEFNGAPQLDLMWSPSDENAPVEYDADNYVAGSPWETETDDRETLTPEIVLRSFAAFTASSVPQLNPINLANALMGRKRQGRARVMHDEIVQALGNRLESLNYNVTFDPNSVDVFASRDKTSAILEVKTVGPRNALGRLRLGTGQLIEYRRRIQQQNKPIPLCVLVLGVPKLPPPLGYWRDVIQEGAGMALIGFDHGAFRALTLGPLEREIGT